MDFADNVSASLLDILKIDSLLPLSAGKSPPVAGSLAPKSSAGTSAISSVGSTTGSSGVSVPIVAGTVSPVRTATPPVNDVLVTSSAEYNDSNAGLT